tara:strand:+ start:1065 stop:1553 length:489 start_codon:yes stop_codon:yes gene_type:complete
MTLEKMKEVVIKFMYDIEGVMNCIGPSWDGTPPIGHTNMLPDQDENRELYRLIEQQVMRFLMEEQLPTHVKNKVKDLLNCGVSIKDESGATPHNFEEELGNRYFYRDEWFDKKPTMKWSEALAYAEEKIIGKYNNRPYRPGGSKCRGFDFDFSGEHMVVVER